MSNGFLRALRFKELCYYIEHMQWLTLITQFPDIIKFPMAFLGGMGGKWVFDRLLKTYLQKAHPENICLKFENKVNVACNFILRKSVEFNNFLEGFKKDYPEAGKLVEDSIIDSMTRIQSTVNETTNKVIENIKK